MSFSSLVILLTEVDPDLCVTVNAPAGRAITTSSPKVGTLPVLQLAASSQKPSPSIAQEIVVSRDRSSSCSINKRRIREASHRRNRLWRADFTALFLS